MERVVCCFNLRAKPGGCRGLKFSQLSFSLSTVLRNPRRWAPAHRARDLARQGAQRSRHAHFSDFHRLLGAACLACIRNFGRGGNDHLSSTSSTSSTSSAVALAAIAAAASAAAITVQRRTSQITNSSRRRCIAPFYGTALGAGDSRAHYRPRADPLGRVLPRLLPDVLLLPGRDEPQR